jgi:hypothetical protein
VTNYSPVLATGSGLLFNGSMDRYLRALDADNGRVLWQTRLPSQVVGGAVTYSINGRQYIAARGDPYARKVRLAVRRARSRPRNEPPPYKPEAEARRKEYVARRGIDDPMALCLLSGVPRISGRPLPFQIVHIPDQVIILYEVHHAFRIIPTDGRPHPGDLEPSYLGDSVGRWERDTFVVDVVGFNTRTWLAGTGTFHSEKLRVTERYTRDSYDTILYEVTMEDPEVFTKPWRTQEIFRLRPNERIREYECIEDNQDLLRIEKLMQNESQFRRAQ